MEKFRSNCYGFVHAGLNDTDDEFYLSRDEVFEGIKGHKKIGKLNKSIDIYKTLDQISEDIMGIEGYKIIEIFDSEKRSQHVAFLDESGNIYDQNGPDGPIRINNLKAEELLDEYNQIFGTTYYQIYSLNPALSKNVDNFLKRC